MNISNLQISKGNWHSGLTQASHLYSFFLAQPAVAYEVAVKAYNKANEFRTPISYLTSGAGNSKGQSAHDIRWSLMGDSQKAIPVSKTFGDGGATVGLNSVPFRLGFPEKWFSAGDYLRADNGDYAVYCLSDGEQDGSDWVYRLQLVGTDQTRYLPAALVAIGAEFSKGFTAVERDGSKNAGQTSYALPFMLETTVTTLRKMYSITGAVLPMVMNITITADNGQTSNTWMRYAEWQCMSQWFEEIEYMFIYGQQNKHQNGTVDIKGISGNPVYIGAGLQQQIASSNRFYYTALTEQRIRDFMFDLSYGTTAVDGNRNFVCFTGEMGFLAFDAAMKTSAGLFRLIDSHFVTGSGNELSLGGQFKTYEGANGTKMTLKHLPLYDNTVHNRQMNPQTQRPAESQRFTVLDFGSEGGESNIQKIYTNGREHVQWSVEGSCGPGGFKNGGTGASSTDGYDMYYLTEAGIMIKNPVKCAELILDISAM